jgi:hypothetical protein
MNRNQHQTFNKIDENRIEMSLCDDLMNCPACVHSIYKIQQKIVDDIVNEYDENIPLELARIKISIPPTETNVRYFSFEGIENIVKQLFQSEESSFKKEIVNTNVYLKVFFTNDILYTIPLLNIEFFIFKKIEDNSLIHFSNFLSSKLINLIGCKGIIERKKLTHSLFLRSILETPLLMGQKPFSLDGIYKSIGFSKNQLTEMNYMLGISIMKLDCGKFFSTKELQLFDDARMMIYKEKKELEIREKVAKSIRNMVQNGEPNINMEKGDIEDVRYSIACNRENEGEEINELIDKFFNSKEETDDDTPF